MRYEHVGKALPIVEGIIQRDLKLSDESLFGFRAFSHRLWTLGFNSYTVPMQYALAEFFRDKEVSTLSTEHFNPTPLVWERHVQPARMVMRVRTPSRQPEWSLDFYQGVGGGLHVMERVGNNGLLILDVVGIGVGRSEHGNPVMQFSPRQPGAILRSSANQAAVG